MADISKIKLPNGTKYDIKDASVPSWAKQSTKPSYDAQEICAQYTGGYGQAQHVQDALDDIHDYKQDTLVSGTNIKTINNNSILGSGNLEVGGGGTVVYDGDSTTDTPYDNLFMETVVSGVTNVLLNTFYPVGSIYMSVNNTNPSTMFGGTWVQLKDRFLLGAGSTYTAGDTGGSSSQTVNFSNGYANIGFNASSTGYLFNIQSSQRFSASNQTAVTGWGASTKTNNVASTLSGSQTLNNMPPYLVVYMWKRTA